MAPVTLQRILCPTDFSPAGRKAVDWAVGLGHAFDAEVILVHVVEPLVTSLDPSFGPIATGQVETEMEQHAARTLERRAGEIGFPRLRPRLVRGRAWSAIVETAAEEHADLIVMGTHGLTGLAHLLLGSTASKVVQRAGCPVLTVKPEGGESEQS